MNTIENQLIFMLNKVISSETLLIDEIEDIKWHDLVEEAREHHISPLIYSVFNKDDLIKKMDNITLYKWKKEVFYSGVSQNRHISRTVDLLKEFYKNNIPVIALKGLIVRKYYPKPQLRTMSDADLLVHREDLDKVINMMINLEYIQSKHEDDHGAHIVFNKQGCEAVEVHWTLANKVFFKGNSYEEELWNNVMEVEIYGTKCLSLSLEDLAIHLIIHMAVHLAHKGFGLRQPLDFVLLVNNEIDNIDWYSFIKKSQKIGIYKFTIVIVTLCNKYFNMKIPKEIEELGLASDKCVKLLMEDVLNSGIYGNKDKSRVFASEFAFEKNKGACKGIRSIWKKYMKLLFPSIKDMGENYDYAKKGVLLIPIAWIHHLISGVFNKDYSFTNKVKMATSTVAISNKRNKLLKELEL